ncbi:MAG: hypothetical protein F4Z35_08450 [Dehalococcoidia bacterium]|nr:hypothetical protein [Dehalococcoidia bacterium]
MVNAPCPDPCGASNAELRFDAPERRPDSIATSFAFNINPKIQATEAYNLKTDFEDTTGFYRPTIVEFLPAPSDETGRWNPAEFARIFFAPSVWIAAPRIELLTDKGVLIPCLECSTVHSAATA